MKKVAFALIFFVQTVSAQYKLSGSAYVQNFNALSAGLPEGWSVDTNAKVTSAGGSAVSGFVAVPAAATRWNNTTGGFKNVASANGFTSFAAATNPLQLTAADRALAIKQTGSFGDPGAAFTFQIDHTFRLSDFELEFKLQSLDSSNGSKITTWQVQYGLGKVPGAFKTISSGLMTTGDNTFSNQLKYVSFGSAIDDKREPLWIRIVTTTPSTGTGSRTTTAIDDVSLRWTGTAVPGFRPLVQRFAPANGASAVAPGTLLSVQFSRNIALGSSGSISVKNETDNKVQVIHAGSSFLSASGPVLFISGVKLELAKTYHITFDSAIVDTALATAYALEDTTAWRFTTAHTGTRFIIEYFDTACAKRSALPEGWKKYNTKGAEEWECNEHKTGNSAIRMFGHNGSAPAENEDWLISPMLEMSAPDAMGISFHLYKTNRGAELQVMTSDDYAGSGSPDSATWIPLSIPMSTADIDKWRQYVFPVITFKDKPFYVGFKYTSDATAAYDLRLDSFMLLFKTAIAETVVNKIAMRVIGYPHQNNIHFEINSNTAGDFKLELFNASGQLSYLKNIGLKEGVQSIDIDGFNLLPGMYVVKLSNGKDQCLEKCMIR